MPRSPTDATRFTATGPYAASGTSFTSSLPHASATAPSGSQINFGAPAPAGESPQQKIARLRAAAAAAKIGKESTFDGVVRVGRLWADRAHRFTAMSLIGLTVLSGMVAAAGISDMLIHNRKRKKEWLAEQRAKEAKEVGEARIALDSGEATEDQLLLINRERAKYEAAEAKRNRPGMFKRTTNWMFSGLASEEQKGGKLGAAAATANAMKEAMLGEKEDRGVLQAVEEKMAENRRTGERVGGVLRPVGGPLDREAERTASVVTGAGKTWLDWITGR